MCMLACMFCSFSEKSIMCVAALLLTCEYAQRIYEFIIIGFVNKIFVNTLRLTIS